MNKQAPYLTAAAVAAAIKTAAQAANAADSSISVDQRIRFEYFNRFLNRVFSEKERSEWVLKGGTGILARVPSARSTQDVDLFRQGYSLDQAADDLVRLASLDIGDQFRFVHRERSPIIGNNLQPYTHGCRLKFDVYIGVAKKGALNVDVASGLGITADVDTVMPAISLNLPRLPNNPYRLYPLVDQVADKVCATIEKHNGLPSSREKDLVDLVIIAKTQTLAGVALRNALVTEMQRRQMKNIIEFAIPSTWGRGYAKLSKAVPDCEDFRNANDAAHLVKRLIDPVLHDAVDGMRWDPHKLAWTRSSRSLLMLALMKEGEKAIREKELEEGYEEAFLEWETSGEAEIWDRATSDGLVFE